MQFAKKCVVVTGATQGLGAAIATVIAERGAEGIVLCGRSREKGEAVARRISSATKAKVIFVPTDLSKVEDCQALIARADQEFGRIDVLVNSAGKSDRGTILDTTPELFDSIMNTNVRGPYFLMQDTIKIMLREKIEGTIVNICSMSSKGGQPFISAYCASKGALATLTQNTAFAVMRNRIRVNGLNIGWMASDGEDRIMKLYHGAAENWLEQAAAKQPFGRLIDPAEVARAVAFLASAESGLMTGSMVNFDQSVWGAYDETPHPTMALS